jgi:hypothetical protein
MMGMLMFLEKRRGRSGSAPEDLDDPKRNLELRDETMTVRADDLDVLRVVVVVVAIDVVVVELARILRNKPAPLADLLLLAVALLLEKRKEGQGIFRLLTLSAR